MGERESHNKEEGAQWFYIAGDRSDEKSTRVSQDVRRETGEGEGGGHNEGAEGRVYG